MFKLSSPLHLCLIILLFAAGVASAQNSFIQVDISGVDAELAETLRNGLSIERQKDSDRLSERYLHTLHQAGFDELKQMLTVFGYYRPVISGELEHSGETWQAHYHIDRGQPVTISSVDVHIEGEAEADEAFQDFIKDFPLKVGDTLNHQQYEEAKKSILRLGSSHGYFDGEFTTSKIEVNPEEYTATIYLYYKSGVRYRFEEIRFPDTVVGEDLLNKLLPFTADSPYLDTQVLKLRSNLSNSGYFDAVSVRPQPELRQQGHVPLDIRLDSKARHLYTAGLGYGTDTGARMALGWENRYVNKHGHRLQAGTRLSQISNSISADYTMPYWSENISLVGINTEYKQLDTDTSQSQSYALGGYYKRQRWGWNETGSVKFLQEDFDVSDDEASSLLLIPGISWSRTWADDTLYTRHGGRLSLALSGASESLLSDVSFGQMVLRGKYIRSLGEKGRFITRAALGATEVSDFNELPTSLRFFAGGDSSIRGFDYQALGPKDSSGDVVGGRYLAVGSVEYEHMFLEKWGGAVFSDFGNAFNSFSDPIEYSVGVGVRWRSPVGLVRVDVAKALSEPGEPIALHIVIGPDL